MVALLFDHEWHRVATVWPPDEAIVVAADGMPGTTSWRLVRLAQRLGYQLVSIDEASRP